MYTITHKEHKIRIHAETDNSYLAARCAAYMEDEPFTLDWLAALEGDSILYDIGSNIGGFSFIATTMHPNIEIYSFEPNIMNYNIQKLTCLHNNYRKINTFNLALNDKVENNYFIYDELKSGWSGTFSDVLADQMKESEYENPFTRNLLDNKTNVLGLPIDFMIYDIGLPVPNYIKIDVDGNESLIIKGATKMLREPALREVLIEIDANIKDTNSIYGAFIENGFIIENNIDLGRNMKMIVWKR